MDLALKSRKLSARFGLQRTMYGYYVKHGVEGK